MARNIATCIIVIIFSLGLTFASPSSGSVYFTLQNGFIITNATLDGVQGTFIIDSGAPGLVLNSKHYTSSSNETINMVGAGGEAKARIVHCEDLTWGLMELHDLEAISIDLTYLEESLSLEITGLIGFDLFEGYDLLIDYNSKQLSYSQNAFDQFDSDNFISLPMQLHDHMMIVEIDQKGSSFKFGIDTGSRSNLISKSAIGSISQADLTETREIILVGSDQNEVLTREILIDGLHASDIVLESTLFVEHDMSGIREMNGMDIDGILGHSFFENGTVIIDKNRKQIRISKGAISQLLASQ